MSIVQGAIEAALALPLAQKLAAVFIGLPVLAIVINVLSQLVSMTGWVSTHQSSVIIVGKLL
jgi:hypothetical protein